jgi:hypothetical protein
MVIQRASRILRDGVSAGPRAVGADQGPCRHLTHLTYALTWNFQALSGCVRIQAPPASPRDSALMPRQERPGGTTQRLSPQECRQVCHHTAVSGGLRNTDSSLLWYRPGREQFPLRYDATSLSLLFLGPRRRRSVPSSVAMFVQALLLYLEYKMG